MNDEIWTLDILGVVWITLPLNEFIFRSAIYYVFFYSLMKGISKNKLLLRSLRSRAIHKLRALSPAADPSIVVAHVHCIACYCRIFPQINQSTSISPPGGTRETTWQVMCTSKNLFYCGISCRKYTLTQYVFGKQDADWLAPVVQTSDNTPTDKSVSSG